MKNRQQIFYSLNLEDIQEVAVNELDRELTDEEIKRIIGLIEEKINWYDAILNSITEEIG